MAPTDQLELLRVARASYERGRIRTALLGILPAVALTACTGFVSKRPETTLVFGLSMSLMALVMLWYGREPRRGVVLGFATGLIPLVLSLCANAMHHCDGEKCSSLCVPACTIGGLLAGGLVALIGRRKRAGTLYWASSAGISLLTGAMGCACVGYSGIVGLVAGFALGFAPALLGKLR